MPMITTTADLAAVVSAFRQEPYITVDTEFLRDKTYYPQLCLVQLGGKDRAVAVDPLAEGIDLGPLYELMADPAVLKVFHAARQDLEIFVLATGTVPAPLFDTQIAAMVCGFGDQASYETLASRLAKATIDKSSRFTDWSARPLTERQVAYALSDVTHLRVVYEKLAKRLERSGRASWLEDELAILRDTATYRVEPENAWLRLKPRSTNPRFLKALRELAAWREVEAQKRNLPRTRMLKDEALLEVAAMLPQSPGDLSRARALTKGIVEGSVGEQLVDAVRRGLALPDSILPPLVEKEDSPSGRGPLIELLKVLLKLVCEKHEVAQKLVASSADLEAIAGDSAADVPALSGWRREIFGNDALALKSGRLALTAEGNAIRIVRLSGEPEATPE